MSMRHTVIGVFLMLFALSAHGVASKVKTLTVFDKEVHVLAEMPGNFSGAYGTYKYEKEGEPLIELYRDGTGFFQPHGRPAIPIHYWIKVDQKGVVEKQENPTTGSYRVTLVLQYGENPDGNYRSGSYAMWYLTWDAETRCFDILGERFKCE